MAWWLPMLMTPLLGSCRGAQRDHHEATVAPPRVVTPPSPPRVLDRAAYTLDYPADWRLDEKAASFDLDHFFSIDGPGSCHLTVELFPPTLGEKDCLDTQNTAFRGMFKEPPRESSFSTWGSLDGSGTELRGKTKPLGMGRIRNFAHTGDRHTLFVNEFCFDDSLPAAQPGFDIIARSFRLR